MLKLMFRMTVAAALVFSQVTPGIAAGAKKKPAATMTKKKVEKITYWAPWLLTSSARTITCERPCTRYEARVCCYGDP
jgi:hypothetical protein